MKTNHPPSPDALLAFDALARHGSFTAAADSLGCAKSRVSQLVKQLEQELGTVLVLRNTRRVALTEAGQRLAIHARQLREMLDRVRGDVGNVQDCVEGPLVISSASAFAQFLLVPILSELSNQYPGLEMQLQVENRLQDPVAEGLDFCVRTRNVYDDGLVAKPLGFMRETVYASPGYLAQAPRLERPEDLCLHRVLYDSSKAPSETVEWALEKDGVYVRMPVRPVLSCNQYSPLVSGAVAGCGLALLPHYVANSFLATGQLVPVLPGWSHDCWPAFLVYPYRHPLPRKNEVFIQHVVPRLRALLAAEPQTA